MLTDFKFVDLFCGIGGFHQAMTALGGKCVFACDIDEACQHTYYKNYGIMPAGDITKVDAADIPEHDVLCGGFPCQAFSIAGKRLGFSDPTKGTLFFDIMRIVHHHKPKYILLENVRNLASHDGGNTWRVIHSNIQEAGYNVSAEPVIFSPHYIGIPQHRERVFIMCVRRDVHDLPEFFYDRHLAKPCTIDTVLQDESEIANVNKYRLKPKLIELIDMWNEFLRGIRPHVKKLPLFPVTDLFLHATPDEIKNLDQLTESKLATAMRNVRLFNKQPEFISDWLARARHYKAYKGAYRMLEWHAGNPDDPDIWNTVIQFRQSGIRTRRPTHFPTLTAVLQTPYIGKRKRKLTPRECARLQSFPDTFVYDDKDHEAYKQFGNSVNVEVVKLFARFMLGDKEVQEYYSREHLEALIPPKPVRRYEPKPRYDPVTGELIPRRKYVRRINPETGLPYPRKPYTRRIDPATGEPVPRRKYTRHIDPITGEPLPPEPKAPKPPKERKPRAPRPKKEAEIDPATGLPRQKRKYVRRIDPATGQPYPRKPYTRRKDTATAVQDATEQPRQKRQYVRRKDPRTGLPLTPPPTGKKNIDKTQ